MRRLRALNRMLPIARLATLNAPLLVAAVFCRLY
jgi:mannose/fructose-specific phosphotransferase system component IIA